MASFAGFPKEAVTFLTDLAANNNKVWFDAHKDDYQRYLLEPVQEFISEVGGRLQTIRPEVRFDTRTNGQGSLMRIYRDVRFSKDKSPYNTHLAAMFWEGANKKEAPGFGFSLEPGGMGLMAGAWQFPKEQLDAFRSAIVDDRRGSEIAAIVANLRSNGYQIGGEHYKRVPEGFPADHPRGELLRFTGMHAYSQTIPVDVVTGPGIVNVVTQHFLAMAPVVGWITTLP